jgi:4'-phosphopantetheinyl transferase
MDMVRFDIFDRMDECSEVEVERMLPLVSAQRREQALRYKHTFGRFCCLKSWLMLKQMMEQAGFGRMVSDEFRYNPSGKPFIEGAPYFSISHCKEGIAVAVAEVPVGIDIEGVRHADEGLLERVMNAWEYQALMATSPEQRDRCFTRLWTQKEAVVKMEGTGIESFEQLQNLLSESQDHYTARPRKIDTIEKENYIYSIAYE